MSATDRSTVTVITVCLNSAATVERTIRSVLGQTYRRVEHIVVDGGSSDGTLDIVERYRRHLAKVISEPDGGMYDAINKALSVSEGEWIHVLNSDDYYASRTALARAVACLDENYTNYFRMWREYPSGRRVLQSWRGLRWALYVAAFIPHPTLVLSRSQYEAVGPYDPSYRIAGDHELILRCVRRWPPREHPLALTVMTQGGMSAKHLDVSLAEFARATERHGMPRALARSVMRAKKAWWHLRVSRQPS